LSARVDQPHLPVPGLYSRPAPVSVADHPLEYPFSEIRLSLVIVKCNERMIQNDEKPRFPLHRERELLFESVKRRVGPKDPVEFGFNLLSKLSRGFSPVTLEFAIERSHLFQMRLNQAFLIGADREDDFVPPELMYPAELMESE